MKYHLPFLIFFIYATSANTSAQVRLIGDTVVYKQDSSYFTVKHHPEFSSIIIIKDYTAKRQAKRLYELFSNISEVHTTEIKKLEKENTLQKDGLYIEYNSLGRKNKEQTYQKGVLTSTTLFLENGMIESKNININELCRLYDIYQNGKLRYRFPYKAKPTKKVEPGKYTPPQNEFLDGVFQTFDDNGNVTRSIQFSKNVPIADSCLSPIPCPNYLDSIQISHPNTSTIANIQPSKGFREMPIIVNLSIDSKGFIKRKIKSKNFYKSLQDSILLINWLDSIKVEPEKFLGKSLNSEVNLNIILGSKEAFKLERGLCVNQLNPIYIWANCEQYYTSIEVMPEFQGGIEAMYNFLRKNLHFPYQAQRDNVKGRVYVQFVITNEGHVVGVKVLRPLSPECDAEAIRVVELMPPWRPGLQNGKPVSVYYTLPINFNISK